MVEGRIRFELPEDHFETVTGDSLSFHVPRYCSMAFEENSIQVVSGYCRVKQTVDPSGVVTVESEIDASTHAGARLRESSRDYNPPLDDELTIPPAPIELFGRVEGTLHVEVSYGHYAEYERRHRVPKICVPNAGGDPCFAFGTPDHSGCNIVAQCLPIPPDDAGRRYTCVPVHCD